MFTRGRQLSSAVAWPVMLWHVDAFVHDCRPWTLCYAGKAEYSSNKTLRGKPDGSEERSGAGKADDARGPAQREAGPRTSDAAEVKPQNATTDASQNTREVAETYNASETAQRRPARHLSQICRQFQVRRSSLFN
jgi:hypothetical protein